MVSDQILLRLGCSDNVVISAASSAADGTESSMEGCSVQDLLDDPEQDERYSLTRLRLGDRSVTCAARRDEEGTLYVYYLKDERSCPAEPSVPAARLIQGHHLPLVSPGLVALLGYTPWELAQSDLFEKLTAQPAGVSTRISLTDRHGCSRSMICTSYASGNDCLDIFFVPIPESDGQSLFSLIGRWEQMPLASPDELLVFLLDALGISQGAVLSLADGQLDILASQNLEIDLDDPDQRDLIDTSGLSVPVWIDTDGLFNPDTVGEHTLLYPFGRNRSYLFVALFHGEAGGFHQKTEVLLPVMSMRLDLWELATERESVIDVREEEMTIRTPSPVLPGVSVYSDEGFVQEWSLWMEKATGVSAASAVGQPAGRLLDRIGSVKVTEQYEMALEEIFMDEPVEFSSGKATCFSFIGRTGNRISHTIIDADDLDIHFGSSSSPGAYATAGSPASVAEALADAVRITRWEYDMSSEAADSGTKTWLSHRTLTAMLIDLMGLMTPFCPDRWIGLDTAPMEEEDIPGSFFLPGVYHVLRFRVLPVLMPTQRILLERIRKQLQGLGCSLIHYESEDSLQLTIPEALTAGRNMDLVVYSSDSYFLRLCEEVLPSVAESWHVAESPADLTRLQERALALVLRLRPLELPLASAFTARLPSQPVLVVSGMRTGVPLLGSSTTLLQLPVDNKHLLVAIRRLLRK